MQTTADLLRRSGICAGFHCCQPKHSSLSTLAHAHGLTDITQNTAGIEGLTLRVENSGTFQEFNDANRASHLVLRQYDAALGIYSRFDVAADLFGQRIAITEILARAEPCGQVQAKHSAHQPRQFRLRSTSACTNIDRCTLRIDDPFLFTDRASLITLVKRLRAEYPFLERWRFTEALHAWGNSIVNFDNADGRPDDDIAEENLIQANNNGFASRRVIMSGDWTGSSRG